jgi:peptidoglycan/xylan/chitin deacetylase (PgdA/CDA1 family)
MDVVTTTGVPGRTFALTFDDGPNPPDTLRLLDVLAELGVAAVFCLVGEQVRAHPEVAGRIAGAGHVLGNHSLRHDDLGEWDAARVRADLAETSALITGATGVAPSYFRAPFGRWGVTPRVAAELGMVPLGWQLAVEDWLAPGADVLVDRIRAGLEPGGVVLLHDGGGDRSGTVDAVARVVPALLAEGWTAVLPGEPADG